MDYNALAQKYGGTTVTPDNQAPAQNSTASPVDYSALAQKFGGTTITPKPETDILSKANDAVSWLPGQQIGKSIGTLAGYGIARAKDFLTGSNDAQNYDLTAPSPLQTTADAGSALLTAGIGIPELGSGVSYGAKVLQGSGIGAGITGLSDIAKGDTNVGNITKNTAIGGLVGGAGTAAIEGLGAGANYLSDNIKSKLPSSIQDAYTNQIRGILKLTPKMTAAEDNFAKDTPDFLVKEGIAPLLDAQGTKLDTTAAANALAEKSQAENDAFESILQADPRYINVNQAQEDAINAAKSQFKGTDQSKAIQKIKSEFSAYQEQFPSDITGQNGEPLLPSADINKIKKDAWSKTNFTREPDKVLSDTNYIIGNSLKNSIESAYGDSVPIRDLNKRLGDFASAAKILDKRNGVVLGGGRLPRYLGSLIGSAAGSIGGPAGELLGGFGGNKLVEILQNPKISTAAARALLDHLGTLPGGDSIIEQATKLIGQREMDAITTLKLPSGHTDGIPNVIPLGPKTDTSGVRLIQGEHQIPDLPQDGGYPGNYIPDKKLPVIR